jgi:hypothetical protein
MCAQAIPEGQEDCLHCRKATAPVLVNSGVVKRRLEEIEVQEKQKSQDGTKAVWARPSLGAGVGYPTDPKLAVEFYTNQLMAMQSQRKPPLSRGMKVIIFFVSMLLGGIVVWLLK